MNDYERRRKERLEYEADVEYEVWRSGGNPDRVNRDRVNDSWYGDRDVDSAARRELNMQRPRHEPEEWEE